MHLQIVLRQCFGQNCSLGGDAGRAQAPSPNTKAGGEALSFLSTIIPRSGALAFGHQLHIHGNRLAARASEDDGVRLKACGASFSFCSCLSLVSLSKRLVLG